MYLLYLKTYYCKIGQVFFFNWQVAQFVLYLLSSFFVGKGENAGPPPGFKGRDEQTKRGRASEAYQDDR